MAAASDRDGVIFSLSAVNHGDGPEGRALLRQLGSVDHPVSLLMDRAYEGDETRALATEPGHIYLLFLPKAAARILGTMIKSCTSSAARSRGFFAVSSAFAAFSLAMINWMLSSYLLSISLLLLMRLCEHSLENLWTDALAAL